MKSLVLGTAFVARALSQGVFEPVDFNITKALLDNGVTVSSISELTQVGRRDALSGCSMACNSLKLIFGDDEVETRAESTYTTFISSFWAAQQRLILPQCIVKPEKALDVSTTILISRLTQCPFAARSGGHSAVPGGSNIDGGITISFEKLGKMELSANKKIFSFQPGHTWYDIYTNLEKENLTIIGGRVASVGVGGLTLGGGISYFSSMYGLACDNVESYELVTASGMIINVSENSFSDLYWALRGGGNNFGLVTEFNVATIPRAPQMWGGARTYLNNANTSQQLISAYYNLGMSAKKDPKAHQILTFGWGGIEVALTETEYMDPVANASVFAEYNSIPGAIADATGVKSLAQLTLGLDPGAGDKNLRQTFWTWSMKLDKEMATVTKDIFFEELPPLYDVAGIVPSVSLQVLTEPIMEFTAVRGGNTLGLNPKDGPLINALVGIQWLDAADDTRVYQFCEKVKNRVIAVAKAKGKYHPFIYMNYGSPYQNVVAGYGAANQARLKAISKKYDPTGVFEKLQPGYFKLDGAPKGEVVV